MPAADSAGWRRTSPTWSFCCLVGLLLTVDWEPLGPQKGLCAEPHLRRRADRALSWRSCCCFSGSTRTSCAGAWTTRSHSCPSRRAARAGGDDLARLRPGLLLRAAGASRTIACGRPRRHTFPGLGKEFMPPLDEGSFLYMPTTMPHASIGEALDILQKQDIAIRAIPEIESVVGKIGRVESALDPAPIGMIETVINYKSEYIVDQDGRRMSFRYDRATGEFARDPNGRLIPDPHGRPYRQWRSHIESPDDIWQEIAAAAEIPGTTSAPKLQPIAARIVMLQSGMRAPMGVKIKGPDLATIEKVGLEIERILKEVPSIDPGHGHRRPDRRQAVPGDRAGSPGARPLRHAHPALPGCPRGGRRRHQGDDDRGGPPAVPRARALPAGTARQHRAARTGAGSRRTALRSP